MAGLPSTAMPNAPLLPALLTRAMRILPTQPLELALGRLTKSIAQRHPELFDRLGEHSCKAIGIAPTDVPVIFVLMPDRESPRVEVRRQDAAPACDAVIFGPIFALIDMAEGRLDGDALFFSRDIRIEGDVEAVLALRNALDGEGLDLIGEAAAPLGMLAAGPELIGRRCFDLLRSALRTAPVEETPF